ncbi:Zinc finger CCCH domain-containing protein 5 [Acorus calamus]|uniref:Zinc finger CCCH domain-containing protein 5 n=1 Tax=Acorus calamus TaxID=4465 RepID=A0AAV9CD37_ACOCL|nr:Zinc finger CCCH domain-containing protein 5 [Acorus calamus]
MSDPTEGIEEPPPEAAETLTTAAATAANRKEKRKALKKQKRKQIRREAAIQRREEEEVRSSDPAEQLKIEIKEREEAEAAERARREFEEREKLWLEAAEARRRKAEEEAEEEAKREKLLEEAKKVENKNDLDDSDAWDYIEEGPAEIIWQGNEIIVKKKRIRVPPKRNADQKTSKKDIDRPTSNPLPPQSAAFAAHRNDAPAVSSQEVLENIVQQNPNFGTEQDKAHCPFHIKTGVCRFGMHCKRVHFLPDKSCTLLIKNMYNGPGLAWEQDEGLEKFFLECIVMEVRGFSRIIEEGGHGLYTDEEIGRAYEEFYEDVHTEFLKFGEIVNFKVCRNTLFHLRGNVYVQYKSLESAILAYNTINGRYFAGKQITCEFVGVTKWKVAICGEYMKTRLKTCSRGSECNFIHCFRNPGGDYEWADWDNSPPKYWVKKMAVLFGPSDESGYHKRKELENQEVPKNSNGKKVISGRYDVGNRSGSRSSKHSEMDVQDNASRRDDSDENRDRYSRHSSRRRHSSQRRKDAGLPFKHERWDGGHDVDSRDGSSNENADEPEKKSSRSRHSSRRKKDRSFLYDQRNSEEKNESDDENRYEREHIHHVDSSGGDDDVDRSKDHHYSSSKKRDRHTHKKDKIKEMSWSTGGEHRDGKHRSTERSPSKKYRGSNSIEERYGAYHNSDGESSLENGHWHHISGRKLSSSSSKREAKHENPKKSEDDFHSMHNKKSRHGENKLINERSTAGELSDGQGKNSDSDKEVARSGHFHLFKGEYDSLGDAPCNTGEFNVNLERDSSRKRPRSQKHVQNSSKSKKEKHRRHHDS